MGITIGTVAAAAAIASAGVGIAKSAGAFGSGGSTTGGGGGSGGLSVLQSQFANSIKLNQQPEFGGSKEPPISNPDMPLQPTKAQPEKAASKWNINSTPTTAVGDEQAKQDSQSIWADRLNKYLDYSTRQLG